MTTPCGEFGVGAVALLLAHFVSNGHFTHVWLVGGVFNGVHALALAELEGEARIKQHSTTAEALRVARGMRAYRTLLTHFSQR